MIRSILKKRSFKTETIVATIFLIIVSISAIYVTVYYFEETEIKFTSKYKNLDVQAAFNMINKTKNLIIIDCRGLEGCGPCQIKSEGRLDFDFVYLNINPIVHYNKTENLLIYSKDGTVSEEDFCKELINHVYGKICNLKGGFDAWKAAGYPVSYLVPSEYFE